MDAQQNYTQVITEEKPKKKNKKPLIAIIIIIAAAVIIGIAFAGIEINNEKQRQAINAEIDAINSIVDVEYYEDADRDALYSHLNSRVSSGKYAPAENAAKDYLIEFYDGVFGLIDTLNDDRALNLLSAENIKNDGPQFTETRQYISELKDAINNEKEIAIKTLSAEGVAENAQEAGLSGDALEFYNKIMEVSDTVAEDSEYVKSLDEMLETLSYYEEAINLLSDNAKDWEVDGDTVYFDSQALLDEYNAICEKIG